MYVNMSPYRLNPCGSCPCGGGPEFCTHRFFDSTGSELWRADCGYDCYQATHDDDLVSVYVLSDPASQPGPLSGKTSTLSRWNASGNRVWQKGFAGAPPSSGTQPIKTNLVGDRIALATASASVLYLLNTTDGSTVWSAVTQAAWRPLFIDGAVAGHFDQMTWRNLLTGAFIDSSNPGLFPAFGPRSTAADDNGFVLGWTRGNGSDRQAWYKVEQNGTPSIVAYDITSVVGGGGWVVPIGGDEIAHFARNPGWNQVRILNLAGPTFNAPAPAGFTLQTVNFTTGATVTTVFPTGTVMYPRILLSHNLVIPQYVWARDVDPSDGSIYIVRGNTAAAYPAIPLHLAKYDRDAILQWSKPIINYPDYTALERPIAIGLYARNGRVTLAHRRIPDENALA